jgi:SAM-dependent methyltransferase
MPAVPVVAALPSPFNYYMSTTIHYNACPVCGSGDLQPVLSVKDFTVSQEYFPVVACKTCTLLFTQDVPNAAAIGPYYRSEDYISHTNTSKGLVNKLYQTVRGITMKTKRKLIEKQSGLKSGKLLDMGCGTGTFIHAMQHNGWQVTGMEPDETARQAGKQAYGLVIDSPEQFYHLPAETYDVITLWHVLEHVHDLHQYIAQLKKILKPNGRIFIAVPNYQTGEQEVYKAYWAAYDVPRHLYHFSPQSVRVLMQQHGLTVSAYKPMWFDSYYIALLSSRYKNGRSNWLAAFWHASLSNIKALGNPQKCSSVIYVIQH